jgi:hypothetical protein
VTETGKKDVQTMITLEKDRLAFRFPDLHEDAVCSIKFQRTLRIPDDEKDYPLPPGLGNFPLRHLDDFAGEVPARWLSRGGVIMPMHQAEAMWVSFNGGEYPFAVKIATGKICAVSGDAWVNRLNRDPQDYVVLPEQPWLDGYCVEKGAIRQFVAMPLGDGYSVEEQITGSAEHGGLQIIVYPMKRDRYEALMEEKRRRRDLALRRDMRSNNFSCDSRNSSDSMVPDMGFAPGGRMHQEIYNDPYGLDAWEQRYSSRCFVTIANSAVWTAVTGEHPPTTPPTATEYTERGLPWFDYYGGDGEAVDGAGKLAKLDSVATKSKLRGLLNLFKNEPVEVEQVIGLRRDEPKRVREMLSGAE